MQEWLASNFPWIFSGIGVVVLVALANAFVAWRRRRKSPPPHASTPAFGEPPKTPQPGELEVLPLSFNAYTRQEIPQLEVWLYVVNHLGREALIESLKIPQFAFTGGPVINEVSLAGEPRLPARHTTSVLLRRPLIDSEVRAIQRSQQRNPSNASFRVVCRVSSGRRRIELDLAHVPSNGWVEGVSAPS